MSLALFALEVSFPFIDPRLIGLPGPFELRWYGLGYLVGFVIAYYALKWLGEQGFVRLESKERVGDLIGFLVLGVVVGGRLGYILFYSFDRFVQDPLMIFRIWQGGLSFHGGFIGVVLVAVWFTRRHGIRFTRLLDSLALSVPAGIFLVRIANFINGELYGRVTTSDVPWAVRFPTDPVAIRLMDLEGLSRRAREEAILRAEETGLWDAVRDQVPLRHPSQIYESLGEGLLVGIVLWSVLLLWRRRGARAAESDGAAAASQARAAGARSSSGATANRTGAWSEHGGPWPPPGLLAGIFIAGYGSIRSVIELFRQPDAQFRDPDDPLGTVLGPLTMGQVLSLLMVAVGISLAIWAWRRRGRAEA